MFRSTRQLSDAHRSARPFLDVTVVGEAGDVWVFWSLAPSHFTRPGVESVWLTNGSEFRPAGVERTSGTLVACNSHALAATLAELDTRASTARRGQSSDVRLADDSVSSAQVVLPERSPGCTCPGCGSRAERAAALVRYATNVAA